MGINSSIGDWRIQQPRSAAQPPVLESLGLVAHAFCCRGRITSDCYAFAMCWPASSTPAKPWPAAGRCASLTDRSTRSFTSGRHCRRTNRRCCSKGQSQLTQSPPMRKFATLWCWNFEPQRRIIRERFEEALIRHLETFCSNLATISRLSPGSGDSASVTNGLRGPAVLPPPSALSLSLLT